MYLIFCNNNVVNYLISNIYPNYYPAGQMYSINVERTKPLSQRRRQKPQGSLWCGCSCRFRSSPIWCDCETWTLITKSNSYSIQTQSLTLQFENVFWTKLKTCRSSFKVTLSWNLVLKNLLPYESEFFGCFLLSLFRWIIAFEFMRKTEKHICKYKEICNFQTKCSITGKNCRHTYFLTP